MKIIESKKEKPTKTDIIRPKLKPFFSLIKETLKEGWQNLRKLLGIFFRVALWSIGASILVVVVIWFVKLLLIATIEGSQESQVFLVINIVMNILFVLIFAYFISRGILAIFYLLKNDYKKTSKESYQQSKKSALIFVGLQFTIITLFLFFSMLLVGIFSYIHYILAVSAILVVNTSFCVYYMLAVYVFFFEEKRGVEIFIRSQELVRNYSWQVFFYILGLSMIIGLATLFIEIFFNLITYLGPESLNELIFRVANLTLLSFSVIAYLLAPIFFYKLYQDLVRIKRRSN
ncbi:MAG: hypothetical protein ACOX0C_02770 [Patescibacteria group bacterium]|jgi:hypothetical protein